MHEGVLSQVQAAEMGFLWRDHGVTLLDKVHSCEIRKSWYVEQLLRMETYQLRWFGHVTRLLPKRVGGESPVYAHGKAKPEVDKDHLE